VARQLLSSLKDLDMDPSDTVDRLYSSSSSTPTPTPYTALSSGASSPSPSPAPAMVSIEAQLAQLTQVVGQLLAANVAVTNQLSQLQAQHSLPTSSTNTPTPSPAPAAPPSPLPHTSSFVNLKVAPPDPFNGNLAKSEEFLTSLNLYFHGKGGNLTDEQKITVALSYMKGGTAGQWAKRKVKLLQKEGQSWTQFLSDFQASFSDPDPAGTARTKMDLLKQASTSADEYVASFKELMDDTGYNDAALVEKFERGLSKQLVDRIYTLPELPETLDQWVVQALKFDRLQRRREQRSKAVASNTQNAHPVKHSTTSVSSTNPPKQTLQPAKLSDVVPMQVDSSKRKPGSSVCYKCRRPGHFARDCQSKFDINSLDYDSLRAHFKKELEEQAQPKEVSQNGSTSQNFQ